MEHANSDMWIQILLVLAGLAVHWATTTWRIGKMEASVEHRAKKCDERGREHDKHYRNHEALQLEVVRLEGRVIALEDSLAEHKKE